MRKRCNRKPRAVYKPLGIKDDVAFEMPGRVAVSALGQAWFGEDHVTDLWVHGLLVHRIAKAVGDPEMALEGVELMRLAGGLQERHTRTGKWGVTGDEKVALVAITGETLPWLTRQDNVVVGEECRAILQVLN